MRKTSVYLPEGLKERLSQRAAASGIAEAVLIREAIEDRLAPDYQPTPRPEAATPGHLVGVGVGPGPADLLTSRALHALRRADRVIAPCTSLDAIGRAEMIVRQAAPEVVVERMVFVMATDHKARAGALAAVCDQVSDYLESGDEVAFITLGDPNVYSTVSSVVAGVRLRRPKTTIETIAGIMAFQALASPTYPAENTVLTDEQQSMLLLPASAPAEVIATELADEHRTVIFYKGGGRVSMIADHLQEVNRLDGAVLGELIGMPGERIAPVKDVRDRPASYLSVIISPAPEGTGPTPPLTDTSTPNSAHSGRNS